MRRLRGQGQGDFTSPRTPVHATRESCRALALPFTHKSVLDIGIAVGHANRHESTTKPNQADAVEWPRHRIRHGTCRISQELDGETGMHRVPYRRVVTVVGHVSSDGERVDGPRPQPCTKPRSGQGAWLGLFHAHIVRAA